MAGWDTSLTRPKQVSFITPVCEDDCLEVRLAAAVPLDVIVDDAKFQIEQEFNAGRYKSEVRC